MRRSLAFVSRSVALAVTSVPLSLGAAAGLLLGCGGTAALSITKTGPVDGGVVVDSAVPPAPDASAPGDDAGAPPPAKDSGPAVPPPEDGGTVTRNGSCTPTSAQTGTLIDTAHGRLDGTLVYVLPQNGSSRCNGDNSHVHLQVEVSGLVYDIALDIGAAGDEVGMYQQALALPGGAWAEGWHGTDQLAYPSLGLSSGEFPVAAPATIGVNVESLLANTSKISIFCTGYSTGNGCHDVHYQNGNGNDGAIVLDPLAATPTIVFFRFQGQSF